jgi:hypothetical protein
LKKSLYRGRIKASLVVESNHLISDRKTLACKIRALFLYYQAYRTLSLKTKEGKHNNRSYLDNKDVF